MQARLFATFAIAVVHGGTIRSESSALAIARAPAPDRHPLALSSATAVRRWGPECDVAGWLLAGAGVRMPLR